MVGDVGLAGGAAVDFWPVEVLSEGGTHSSERDVGKKKREAKRNRLVEQKMEKKLDPFEIDYQNKITRPRLR